MSYFFYLLGKKVALKSDSHNEQLHLSGQEVAQRQRARDIQFQKCNAAYQKHDEANCEFMVEFPFDDEPNVILVKNTSGKSFSLVDITAAYYQAPKHSAQSVVALSMEPHSYVRFVLLEGVENLEAVEISAINSQMHYPLEVRIPVNPAKSMEEYR